MSEPRTDHDMRQVLTGWMDEVAPERAPSRLLEETYARTMNAPQARTYPWQALVRRPFGGAAAGSGARRGLLAVVALLVLALALVFGAGGLRLLPPTPGPSPTPTPTSSPTAVPRPTEVPLPSAVAISPEHVFPIANPGSPIFDGTTVWVFAGDGLVQRIDPATNAVTEETLALEPGTQIAGIAAHRTGIWVTSFEANLVDRLDPESLALVKAVTVGTNPGGVYADDDAIWVANLRGGSVTRIDPATNKVVATVAVAPVGPGGPHAIDFGLGSYWVSAGSGPDGSGGTVVRIDPETNLIQATIPLPANASACGGFAITPEAVWMSSCFDQRTLIRIDPATNTVAAAIELGGYVGGLIAVDGAPWFSLVSAGNGKPAPLVRIDPATNTIDRVISLGEAYRGEGLVVAAGSVWAQDIAGGRVLRLPLAAFEQ